MDFTMHKEKHMRRHAKLFVLLSLAVLGTCPGFAAEGNPSTPEDSLNALREGNRRYVENRLLPLGDESGLRSELAEKGQSPIAAVVACSDSRVPVERIFNQPLGGLFVIRSAGNTAGVQTMGTVQYGVEHLDLPLVVVMGHTRCGAVEAVVKKEAATGALAKMLEPVVLSRYDAEPAVLAGGDAARETTASNIRRAVDSLIRCDPGLKARIESGRTKVAGAVYDIETGVVEWL